jgi:hypothetical protein
VAFPERGHSFNGIPGMMIYFDGILGTRQSFDGILGISSEHSTTIRVWDLVTVCDDRLLIK